MPVVLGHHLRVGYQANPSEGDGCASPPFACGTIGSRPCIYNRFNSQFVVACPPCTHEASKVCYKVHATSTTSIAVASDDCTSHGATQSSLPCIHHSLRTAALPLMILAGCLPWGVLLTYFNGEHVIIHQTCLSWSLVDLQQNTASHHHMIQIVNFFTAIQISCMSTRAYQSALPPG